MAPEPAAEPLGDPLPFLANFGAMVVSTIMGEMALLSGTSEKERAKDATGGLLRKLGSAGVLGCAP